MVNISRTVACARTSTNKRDLGIEVQFEAFKIYELDLVFKEQVSGRKEDREELQNALSRLKQGDTFLIYRIDRLSRSVRQLINLEADLREQTAVKPISILLLTNLFVMRIKVYILEFQGEWIGLHQLGINT